MCVWSTDAWEKQASKFLQIPSGRVAPSLADTRVQFHLDQIHLLAVHETQIAIFEAPKLECQKQVWCSFWKYYSCTPHLLFHTMYIISFKWESVAWILITQDDVMHAYSEMVLQIFVDNF